MAPQPTLGGGPETITHLANSVFQPFAMRAGMQLDLFTPLRDGPMTAEALAAVLGARKDRLEQLLYALATTGLLTVGDGAFANSDEADRYLVRGRPDYMGGLHALYTELWRGAFTAAESVLSGTPQSEHDFAGMSEAELEAFFRGTYPGAVAAGRQLAGTLGLARFRHVLDVAGGSGGVALGICGECPGLRATVVDLPSVAPITRRIVDEAGLADRVDVIAADVVERRPAGSYDAVVMRNFVQVLSAEQNRRALANVGAAMTPGGTIHILGWVLDDSRVTPWEAACHNLVFIGFYRDGQAYTESEHFGWLQAAGFVDFERRIVPGGTSVITARKA